MIFRQARIGREGEPFTMLKFRSMVVDAEERKLELMSFNEGKGGLFKLSRDPRVTPFGQFLRSFSLDELPQLFNVLAGSMSLVGPRPHLAAELAQMPSEASRRSLVTPGLTGLWQVSGRSDLEGDDAVRLDLRYVENWSLDPRSADLVEDALRRAGQARRRLTSRMARLMRRSWVAWGSACAFIALAIAVHLGLLDTFDSIARAWARPDDVWGTAQMRADFVVEGLRPTVVAALLVVFTAGLLCQATVAETC